MSNGDHYHTKYLAQLKSENRQLSRMVHHRLDGGNTEHGLCWLALSIVFLAGIIYLSTFNIDFDIVAQEGSTVLVEAGR